MLENLFTRLEATGKLPTPPGVVVRLLELSARSDISMKELADTIAMDPGLAAKILRFVNSPMAGVAREVTSLMQAVNLMGIRGVKMTALSFSVLGARHKSRCRGFDADLFAVQSIACGTAGRVLASLTQSGSAQEAFIAGLLSQIGRSALASAIPEEYSKILARAENVPRDLPALEEPALGGTYATAGGQLLRAWGIPESLCRAVESFRSPEHRNDAGRLPYILDLAELAAVVICPGGHANDTNLAAFTEQARRCFGLEAQQCGETLRQIAAEVETAHAILEAPKSNLRSTAEIEDEIRERMTELSLAMHMENQSLARQQEELLRRATTDALTGVGNRAAFDARLSLELERSARNGTPVGLLMIDVDHFKNFNDTHGHLAGDRVLRSAAAILDENIRKVDYLARYGGEEFAVVAPGTPLQGLTYLAERLRASVEAMSLSWDGKELHVTVSIGVGILTEVTDAHAAFSSLVRAADEQLYVAKSSGRNRVSFRAPRPSMTKCGPTAPSVQPEVARTV